jgi:hypothetical protein
LIFIFFFSLISWLLILSTLPNFWKKISLFFVFFVFSLIFEYLGFGYLYYFNFDTPAYGSLVYLKNGIENLFYLNTFVIWFLVLAYSIFFHSYRPNIEISSSQFMKMSNSLPRFYRSGQLFLALICLVLIHYIHLVGFNNLPLVNTFKGASIGELAVLRNNAGNMVNNYHWFKFFLRDGLFFLLTLFLSLNHFYKIKNSKFLFWFTLSILIFASLLTGEKSGIIDLVLLIFISLIIFKKNGIINFFPLIRFFSLSVLAIIGSYILFMPADTFNILILGILDRLLVGQIIPGIFYLELFPVHHPFLLGGSFPNPMGLLPHDPIPLTQLVMNYSGFNEFGDSLGVIGTMPYMFWGEMYANFGYIGILGSLLFVSCLFIYFDFVFLVKAKRSLILMVLYCYLIVHYKDMSVTGLFNFVFDFNLFIMLFIVLSFRLSFNRAPNIC